AEMVRPEPHQPLGESDLGVHGRVQPRLRLGQEYALRHGWRGVGPRLCLGVAGHGSIHAGFGETLLLGFAPLALEAILGGALGIELEDGARGLGPAHECRIVDLAGAWPLEVGEQRAARVRRDGGERAGTRTDAETMQRQGGLRFRIESHATFAAAAAPRVPTMVGTPPQSPTAMSRLRRPHAPWRRRASERRSASVARL